jgi:hypothetical protein
VRDFPQKLEVEDVKMKLSSVQDVPQKVKVEDLKTTLSCETILKK